MLIAAAVATILCSRGAAADALVNLHMRTAAHVVTTGGSSLDLPPGYFVDEPTHDKTEVEFKRLQTVEVQLTAENKSMRASLATWQPGWYTLMGAVVTAVAFGVYLDRKL